MLKQEWRASTNVTNDRFHKNGWNFTVMIQSPADRLPAQHCGPQACVCLQSAAWFFCPFLTFLRWQLGLDNLEMPWACPPPSPWLIRLWVCPSQEPRRRGGDWELWIRETFHGVVNNKVDKVVQNYSRMKSKYGLLPDNILYNDYISCFAVGCSRWLPAPGARLLPAAEPMLINQWIKISLISLLYALWLHFTRKIGEKNRIAQNIQSRYTVRKT